MPNLSFFEIEGFPVAKGVSDGRAFAFSFRDRWAPAPGLVKKEGSMLSQADLAIEFRDAHAALADLDRLARAVPEEAFP